MISARQIRARTLIVNCSLRLGFWLSSGHLLLSGDGLGLGFWVIRRAHPPAILNRGDEGLTTSDKVLGYGSGVRGKKVKSRHHVTLTSPNQVLTRLWWPRAARAKGSGQSNHVTARWRVI